jgi:hypothetical protein
MWLRRILPTRASRGRAVAALLAVLAVSASSAGAVSAGWPGLSPRARSAVDPICAAGPGNETIGRIVVAGGAESSETERPLREGMRGYARHVCTMTGELAGAGYAVNVTSHFTSEVAGELMRFQADHGLAPNGVYDWATESVLTRCLPTGPSTLRPTPQLCRRSHCDAGLGGLRRPRNVGIVGPRAVSWGWSRLLHFVEEASNQSAIPAPAARSI